VGGERYVTLKKKGRSEAYFDDLRDKHIGGVFGYHYGFADFEAERHWLQDRYKISLRYSHERLLDLVLRNRIDVAILNESFLESYQVKHGPILNDLLVSERYDQKYDLPLMVNRTGKIAANTLEGYLDQLKENGQLAQIFAAYGLEKHLVY